MVLVVVGHLQKRSALQAKKADHFELGKTTTGLLVAILRPLELVGSGIWHRQTSAIGNLTRRPSQSCWLVTPAFELLGHLGANSCSTASSAGRGPDSSRWYQPKASFERENALATQALTLCKASRQEEPRSKTWSQKGPKGNQGTKDALPAINLFFGSEREEFGE